jgi:ribose-phosphate pyrophosphokinase
MILFAFDTYRAMASTIQRTACLASGRFRPVRFENAEMCVRVETPTKNENCAILASISPPDEQLLFTLLLAHTLKKEGARRVTAILPYLAYARHDKNKPGESLATAWVGELMRSSGIDEVITVDVHSERAKHLVPIPVLSLSPAEIFALALCQYGKTGATIVAPDEGAIARCQAVQMALGREAGVIPYFEKQRTAAGISHARLIGTVGPQAVIVDDILDTGATLLSACEKLRETGAQEINIMVTHGLFTGERWKELWQLGVERVFCTDSVPLPCGVDSSRIVRLSIAQLMERQLSVLAKS